MHPHRARAADGFCRCPQARLQPAGAGHVERGRDALRGEDPRGGEERIQILARFERARIDAGQRCGDRCGSRLVHRGRGGVRVRNLVDQSRRPVKLRHPGPQMADVPGLVAGRGLGHRGQVAVGR